LCRLHEKRRRHSDQANCQYNEHSQADVDRRLILAADDCRKNSQAKIEEEKKKRKDERGRDEVSQKQTE
jgi:hypothetical protein